MAIRKTTGEFVEAAALDGLSSFTGVHANTSPSVGGAAYDLGKMAVTPSAPTTASASPAASMAISPPGTATVHQPPAALASHHASATGVPAGAPIGGGSPAMQAFLNAEQKG
jgi:hypothetical protein